MTVAPARAGESSTALDRRLLLKLLGAGAGAAALTGTAMPCGATGSATLAPKTLGKALRQQLASYVAAARFEHLPPAVIDKAKEHLVFFFGRAFASVPTARARRSLQLASEIGRPSAAATVIGDSLRLAPADAALVNACLFSEPLPLPALLNEAIHPGVMTLPAALAAGEVAHAPGRELLLAIAIGYEVSGKLRQAAPSSFRPTSLVAGYAATAAAGRLFGLGRPSLIDAFGYAAQPCFELRQSALAELYPGLIGRNGMFAASLAQGSAFRDPAPADAEQSSTRSPFPAADDLPDAVEELGYWEILTALQRPYRSSGHESPAVELLTHLIHVHKLGPQNVSTIQVVLPSSGSRARDMELAARGPFKAAGRACSSIPYSLARALADGRIDAARFADDRCASDPAVARLMHAIEVAFEDGRDSRWTRVTVHTRDGRTLERTNDFFTYELPPHMWHDWLRSSGKRLLPAPQLLELVRLIHGLENVDDVAKLMAAAAPAHAGAHA